MLNKVTLIGYTGKPVEQKYTAGGTAVARVSVATSKRFKKGDEWQSVTQWHDCVLFGKPAEPSNPWLDGFSLTLTRQPIVTSKI